MNNTIFGQDAKGYRASRPSYPPELFDWIAKTAPAREFCWDVGCGSGQAAVALAQRFERVHATDISQEQLDEAERVENLSYACAAAEQSGLPYNCADAVTVATALHWFDFDRFWDEVRRVSVAGALFCGWSYGLMRAGDELQSVFLDPIQPVLEPFWAEGNLLSMRGYRPEEIKMPFEVIEPPQLTLEMDWPLERVIGFARSWSAHARARQEGKAQELAAREEEAREKLGEGVRHVSMDLTIVAGRVA